jgi:hypothetical protein
VQNSKVPQIHESKRTKPINFQSTAEHNNLQRIVDGSWSLQSLRPAKQFSFFPGIFFFLSEGWSSPCDTNGETRASDSNPKTNKTKYKTKPKKKGGKQQQQVIIAVGSEASKQSA